MISADKNSSLKIAVIGAGSMIGSRFCELTKQDFELIEADLSVGVKIDITNFSSVERFFKVYDFDWLILFSAFTDVDGAEEQRQRFDGPCWLINVEGTTNVAKLCDKFKRKLIYFSTDFIFKGDSGPYSETSQPAESADEISWYGWTKLEGERRIFSTNCQFLIARISYPFRANFAPKTDFVRNILSRLTADSLYPMYTDQFLTPTFIDDIVLALTTLIKANQEGIFNVVDCTTLSAYEAACEIAKVFNLAPNQIKKGSLQESLKLNPHLPKRPLKGGLLNAKIQDFLAPYGMTMLDFQEALFRMKEQMGENRL